MGQTKRNQKWAYVFYIWACIVRKCGQAGVRVCDLLCYCLWCCTQEMKIFPFCFMGTQDCHRMYVLADPRLFNLSTRGVTSRRGRLTSLMVIGRDYRAADGPWKQRPRNPVLDKTTTEWRLPRPHRQRRTHRAQREPASAVSVPGGTVRATLTRRLLVLRVRQCTGLSRDCVYLS